MSKRSKKARSEKKTLQSPKTMLFVMPIILTTIGLFFIFEASSVSAFRALGDSFYFLKLQSLWFAIGIGVMIFFSLFDHRRLYYLSFPALLATIVLLILVLIPGFGHTVAGARRWIDIGPIKIQPTELTKFSVILYLCSWFLYKEKHRFFSFTLLLGFIIGLVMIQPDMGTAIIIFSLFIIIYFISGQKVSHLMLLIPTAAAGFVFLVRISPYRLRRLTSFLNPTADPQGIGYHINQILISLASGGLLGRGFAESRQKYQFLPEAHTDSIFAIIGEEYGFVGAFVLLFLYLILIYNAYRVAKNAPDRFGQLLAGGIFALVALEVIINLGGMVGLMPLTGVPLPFISYGGSSLLVFFALMGILINIAKR